MDFLIPLFVITGIYSLLYFFNFFFTSCSHYPYIQFLKNTGLEIRFLQIRWSTTAFNRTFIRWGNSHNQVYDRWFTIGTLISLLMLPIALFLLMYSILLNHFPDNKTVTAIMSDKVKIEPILPGVNLPVSELGYYALTLVFSSVVHELGHALAAVREDVHVVNVGLNIFFIFPIAYVNLSSDKLMGLPKWKALKIFCAGIWHNLILTLIAYILYSAAPFLYSTVFHVNTGMYIKHIDSISPLLGDNKGLNKGDIITSINHCDVLNEATYYNCLLRSSTDNFGYCVSNQLINSLDSSGYCCKGQVISGSLCFTSDKMPQICLQARPVITAAISTCTDSCNNEDDVCLRPLLGNATRLMKITRQDNNLDVIYIGLPSDLWRTVEMSPFVPKFGPAVILAPDIVMRTLQYLAMFSLGLALVNSMPSLAMDGQYILNALLCLLLGQSRTQQQIQNWTIVICLIGTFVLVWHVVYCIYKSLLM